MEQKQILAEMDQWVRRVQKDWQSLQSAQQEWDLKKQAKLTENIALALQNLQAVGEKTLPLLSESQEKQKAEIDSPEYITEIENALNQAGVPLQGVFPNYEFPPFELNFLLAESQVYLKLGRQREKLTALEPKALAAWVAKRYKRITEKKFDAERFLKELLGCYKLANQLSLREGEVLWGRAVPLDLIYDLLTLRQEARKEYPKTLFIYELARLKENFGLRYKEYEMELGFARNQGKSFTLVDSHGRESRISSLAIYEIGES